MNYHRRFFLLMGLSALVTAACSRSTPPAQQTSAPQTTKRIQHAFGEIDVPTQPNRVVVLEYIVVEAVVAHGLQPIGIPQVLSSFLPYLELDTAAVADVGLPLQPNLEKILALQPDLILTSKLRLGEGYDQLAQIAPTVVFDIDSDHQWRELAHLCGEVLGQSDETQKLSTAYDAKLQAVKAQLSQAGEQPQVSLVSIWPGRIAASGTETFAGSILADAGIARPPSQSQPQGQNISLETLELVDGDVIFVPQLQDETELATDMRSEIDRIKANPLWAQLEAVKNNRVYEVGSHWMIGSYIAANLVLDDLLKYLVG
jgi:iron complex transport system substrate-binding protein